MHVLCSFSTMMVSAVADSTLTISCESENDDSFFNRCRRERNPGFWSITANFVVQWVNPTQLAILALGTYVFLPVVLYGRSPSNARLTLAERKHYSIVSLKILNFLHRVCFSLPFNVGFLYLVFRQLRPCRCGPQGGPYTHVGSRYGMPSGDAMAGGLLAGFLFDEAPLHPIVSRAVAPLVPLLVAAERMSLGYHSLGQVTAGTAIGIALHYYSTRLPQYMIFVDVALELVVGPILLLTDSSLLTTLHDANNIIPWFISGMAYDLVVVIMLGRRWWKQRKSRSADRYDLSASLVAQTRSPSRSDSGDRSMVTLVDASTLPADWKSVTDMNYVLFALLTFGVVYLWSVLEKRYCWMSRLK